MTLRVLIPTLALFCIPPASSGAQAPDVAAQRAAMKKLDFLFGQWKGEGWMEFIPGQRRPFKGTENVQWKLDSILLVIDGLHRGEVGGKPDVVVQHAFAIVSYDDKAKRYRFQGFTTRGNHEDTEAKVSDGQLIWGMKIAQFGDVRYTIKLDDKGRWFEIGEVSSDGGEWRKFFEMTLERTDSPDGKNKVKEDLAKLQGTWSFETLEVEGEKVPDALRVGAKLDIKEDRFVTTPSPSGSAYKGILRLDTTKNPKTIDMEFTEGPEKGKTSLGIYELDGDMWKICLGRAGRNRPKEFVSKPGSGHALETLKRTK